MDKNCIIIDGKEHQFIQDKPKVDTCFKCSLQDICYEKFEKFVCNIFTNDKVVNGHFELKEK